MQCANRNTVCIEKDERFTLLFICDAAYASEKTETRKVKTFGKND
jgi:hypothetical protein